MKTTERATRCGISEHILISSSSLRCRQRWPRLGAMRDYSLLKNYTMCLITLNLEQHQGCAIADACPSRMKGENVMQTDRKAHPTNMGLNALRNYICPSGILLSIHRQRLDDRSGVNSEFCKPSRKITTEREGIDVVNRSRNRGLRRMELRIGIP